MGDEWRVEKVPTYLASAVQILCAVNDYFINCASLWLTGTIKRVVLGDHCLTIFVSDSHYIAYMMRRLSK